MISIRNILLSVTLIISLVILCFDYAYAYIDPATGSYFLQILLAGLLGALFALKMSWRRIRNFFSRHSSRGGSTERPDV